MNNISEGITVGNNQQLFSILSILVLFAILYFVMLRPESKKKKQVTEMRNSLAVGDTITTIGGIVGTICAVKEESIVIESGADRVRIELAKWSVSSRVNPNSPESTK